jgi:hypothetical protein
VHFQTGDRGFPTLDFDLVRDLAAELCPSARAYPTGSAIAPP